tara:strand:- start:268 stop:495 length:228 start_codon:yes stop_codon:yes gene_type:complete
MKFKKIINKLEMIEGSLDDAFYSLPEYNANEDTRSYIDSARNELYCLKDNIEKAITNESLTFGGDTGVDADFGMK